MQEKPKEPNSLLCFASKKFILSPTLSFILRRALFEERALLGGKGKYGKRWWCYLRIRVGTLVSQPVLAVWPTWPITNLGHDARWL